MKRNNFTHLKRITSIILVLLVLLSSMSALSAICVSAVSVPAEVKGKTVSQVLKMDPVDYITWLMSHENDDYYLNTVYKSGDHRNPNGDKNHAYGVLDTKNVAAMNCTGFVWHSLYMPTKANKGNTSLIPGIRGWYVVYNNNNISRKYFSSKKAMLESGYLEKGDLIWMWHHSEFTQSAYHHMGIYWGDGESDVMWHSSNHGQVGDTKINHNVISEIIPLTDSNILYTVIKVGVPPIVDGEIVSQVETPKVTSFNNSANSTKITWNKVEGAFKYRIFIKNGSSWKTVGESYTNSFTHSNLTQNKEYIYTVRCVDSNGKFISGFNKDGFSNTLLSTPKLNYTSCEPDGIKISFNKVIGADYYRVYVKNANGWKGLGNTESSSFIDKTAIKGKNYTYTVRAFKNDTMSSYDKNGITQKYLETPQITSVKNNANNTKITWNKIDGAFKYRVFIKNGTSWKTIGNTTSNSFNHSGVTPNTTYTYTVRCIDENNKYNSSYNKEGVMNTFLSVPKLTSTSCETNGIKINFSRVDGADYYRVYVKNSNGWKGLGNTENTSFMHKDVESGKSYTYTVRAFKGEIMSYYDTKGIQKNYVATPQITSVINNKDNVEISWDKIEGANKYRVFIKNGSSWKTIGNTTSTTFKHTNVIPGKTYVYTVRCVDQNGKYSSSYDKTGFENTFPDTEI